MVFLVALFLMRNSSVLKKSIGLAENKQKNELTTMTLEELVYKDIDGDGILDWEEPLYGLDPTKKETTPGIPDSAAINKLKSEQGNNSGVIGEGGGNASAPLTETEKFSRELFATISAINQSGTMDQATVDALGATLAEKIKNPVVRKVFLLSDIKIIDSGTKQTIQKYSDALNNIYLKNPIKKGVMTILQEFIKDEENVDLSLELEPVINQTNKIISASLKIEVPKSLSLLHLDLINNFQKVEKNISDMRLFDSDPIVAIGAISQYEKNALTLASSAKKLTDAIKQKLNN